MASLYRVRTFALDAGPLYYGRYADGKRCATLPRASDSRVSPFRFGRRVSGGGMDHEGVALGCGGGALTARVAKTSPCN